MQVRINLRCHQGWFDWVNEYNFQAGLQTWPNLNSQQRKSGWIEFSLSVINTRTASSEWLMTYGSLVFPMSNPRWRSWIVSNLNFEANLLSSCYSLWLLRGRKASLEWDVGSGFWKAASSYTRLFWHLGRLRGGGSLSTDFPPPSHFPLLGYIIITNFEFSFHISQLNGTRQDFKGSWENRCRSMGGGRSQLGI